MGMIFNKNKSNSLNRKELESVNAARKAVGLPPQKRRLITCCCCGKKFYCYEKVLRCALCRKETEDTLDY